MREELFTNAMKKVATHNAGRHSWKKGINHLSDWTAEELKTLRGSPHNSYRVRWRTHKTRNGHAAHR
jgi:hypothetical protein